MTILTKLKIEHAFSLPLESLTFKSLFQGAAIAVDPRDNKLYFWQLQAKETGPGDVEDIYAHRFALDLVKGVATKKDTMIIKRAGHVQSLRVRISVLGNPWLWMGTETYDSNGKTTGSVVHRIMHRRGTVTLDGKTKDVDRVYTGSGSVQVIGSEKNIWLRRPSTPEVYEEHDEDVLRAWKSGSARPKPLRTVTLVRGKTTYQSSCATPDGEILRVNGATENASILISSQRAGEVDFTLAAPVGLKVTSEEPEAVFTWKGQAYALKRFNSVDRRVVSAFKIG